MSKKQTYLIYFCWLLSFISMLGSLFFSDVMKFPPCTMCWYQRIAMYPLVIILLIGSFRGAKEALIFSTPFVLIGFSVALWHNLLHYGIIPEAATPCVQGISCSTIYINWLGFITIPLLSLVSFSLIGMSLFFLARSLKSER